MLNKSTLITNLTGKPYYFYSERKYKMKNFWKKTLIVIGIAIVCIAVYECITKDKNDAYDQKYIQKKEREIQSNIKKNKDLKNYQQYIESIFNDKRIDENESDRIYTIQNKMNEYAEKEFENKMKEYFTFGVLLTVDKDFKDIIEQIEMIDEEGYSALSVSKMKDTSNVFFKEWDKYYENENEKLKKDLEELPSHNWEFRIIVLIIAFFIIFVFYEEKKVEKGRRVQTL